jgi:hypothetical protein
VSPRTRRASPEEARKIAAHARQHLPCSDCQAAAGEPCTQPGRARTVCKSRFVAAAIAIRRQEKAARRTPGQAAELAAVLARLPRVSREEIEACRTPAGGYSFTKAWFLEHGLPYPPIAGWRQAVERDDCTEDPGAVERPGGLASETVTALRNYDWLVRNRRVDDIVLAWDTGTLVYGDGGALIEELARPGFTPVTGDEGGYDDGRR